MTPPDEHDPRVEELLRAGAPPPPSPALRRRILEAVAREPLPAPRRAAPRWLAGVGLAAAAIAAFALLDGSGEAPAPGPPDVVASATPAPPSPPAPADPLRFDLRPPRAYTDARRSAEHLGGTVSGSVLGALRAFVPEERG
ncbi:MAG: hypothetical protein SF028_08835 [Candidatus Sumerlaeia bacterium]|nr:hypothetical protein [Candidatus Sumerlaeia bacterium]